MNLKSTINISYRGLMMHKTRSMLTTLGIVIGVAAIIIVMALGDGARELIVGEISSLGAETAVIQPGNGDLFGTGFFSQSLNERDYNAIRKKGNVPNLVAAMPEVVVPGVVSFEGETYAATTIGGSAEFFVDTFDVYPDEGTIFTEDDINEKDRVAVIGSTVREELFGQGPAIGKFIKIKNEKFRVLGVFPISGSFTFFNLDELVLLPYSSAQTYLLGTSHYNQINVRADNPDNIDKLVFDITATLRETHNIDLGEENDFVVRTQQGLVDQVGTVVSILTSFLATVVAISLVVGGVGIMNIMLVSVTERTKEIGLRKALGATRKDILRQFLIEAVMLTALGGLIGVIIGTVIALLASLVLAQFVSENWQFVFPLGAAILGVGVSAVVGLVFGIYPASQASKKSPIEALRYE